MDKQYLRSDILSKVESGELSLEIAARLLAEIDKVEDNSSEAVIPMAVPQEGIPLKSQQVKHEKPGWSMLLWLIPLLLGGFLTALPAYRLYQQISMGGLSAGFWIFMIPFVIGVFLIFLGWALQNSKWIYIDVEQPIGKKPQRILLSFPIPFLFVSKILPLFENKLSKNIQKLNLHTILKAMDEQIEVGDPAFINVNDEDGTRVNIYLG